MNNQIVPLVIYTIGFYANACIATRGAILGYPCFLGMAIFGWTAAIASTCAIAWLMGAAV